MEINIIYVVSYVVAIIATLILSVYFFREYSKKRLRASLAWGIGFLLYGVTQISHLSTEIFGEITVGKLGLSAGMIAVAIGMALLYYGTSLLFFGAGSFFREKMTVIIFVIYNVYFIYAAFTYPLEGFADSVRQVFEVGFAAPVFLAIGILFYRVSARLPSGDPRKQIVRLVSAGWFGSVIDTVYLGLFLGISAVTDAAINIVHAVAWILILYGMTIGKVGKT
jgi:hypothetical protein